MMTSLSKTIGIPLNNPDLFREAFTHKSYLNEHPGVECNERLEFLGDAVLELIVTEYLFLHYPEKLEGELTTYRSALVRGQHLAEIAIELSLGEYLKLSRGEERSGGREKNYILANTFEALVGAIYLDSGFLSAKSLIERYIIPRLNTLVEKGLHRDAKSILQEHTQEKLGITPHYDVLEESGPDHDKEFTMGVYLGEKKIAKGKGSSKQKAELNAAEKALEKWEKMNHSIKKDLSRPSPLS